MGNTTSKIGKRSKKTKLLSGTSNIPSNLILQKTTLVLSETLTEKYWKVRKVDIRNGETGEVVNQETELEITSNSLARNLPCYGVQPYYPPLNEEERKKDKKNNNKPLVPLHNLFHAYPRLQKAEVPEIVELCKFIEPEMEENIQKAEKQVKEGIITFDCCWYLFKVGKQVAVEHEPCHGALLGTRVISCNYNRNSFPYLDMSGKVIKSDGKEFYEHIINFSISYFPTPTPIESLPVRPLDEHTLQLLEERGNKFRNIALSHRYMNYQGFFRKTGGFGPNKFKADGRVMVDITTHNRLHPNIITFVNPSSGINHWNNNYGSARMEYTLNTHLPEDMLFSTWPTLVGFSFQRKRWGELEVDNLSEISFQEGAFDRLVMKPGTKNLIREMVRSSGPNVFANDFISEKGGGCILLLHGPPGTGKTLTAEAVSEFLHSPLYSVSMGELGVTTQELESNLQQILEVCAIWNASILLDEADIFLEKRNEHDIVRNAMVGIFLRLLEYHQGVLFLTTNRLKTFDPAFQSRVSIAVKYQRLSFESRKAIWSSFLKEAHLPLELEQIDRLSQFKLNGRQIRNVLHLANVVANEQGSELKVEHIEEMLKIAKKWFKDFNSRKISNSPEECDRQATIAIAREFNIKDIYDSEESESED